MKKFSKILSVALLVALVLSLGVTNAFADPTYKITVNNTNSSISIQGKTFNAYKVFDAVYGEGNAVSYSMKSDNFFYTNEAALGVLDDYFDFTIAPNDNTTVIVTLKTTTNEQNQEVPIQFGETEARAMADDLTEALTDSETGVMTLPSEADGTGTGSDASTAVITVPAAGYYLVTGSVMSKVDNTRSAETAIALVPVKDATAAINAKGDIPDLTKEITAVKENGTAIPADRLDDAGKAAVAKVGSVVEYKLTSKVPDTTGYEDYIYIFSDTMAEGLTFDSSSVAVTVGTGASAQELNASTQYVLATEFADDSPYKDCTFTVTIPFSTLQSLQAQHKGDPVYVTYSATVNESALTYNYEKNTAQLEYSDHPGYDSTNRTPEQHTYVIDINIDVNKYAVDPETGDKLPGAEFKLYKTVTTTTPAAEEGGEETSSTTKLFYKWADNKVTWVADTEAAPADVFTTNDKGKLDQQIRGLDQGTYFLLETKAPTGFNLLKTPIEITISVVESEDGNTVTYTSNPGTVSGGTIDLSAEHDDQPVDTIDVLNQSGTELPSTGGIGTTIFYVVGGVLVLAAIILLVTKKRMSE